VDDALWFVGPRKVEFRPLHLEPVGDREVRVRTIVSGVSAGTELLAFRGELPAELVVDESFGSIPGTFTYPFQYGYSAVGAIDEVGAGVRDLAVGDVVFSFQPHQTGFVASSNDVVRVVGLEPRHAVLLPYVETALQVVLDAGSVLGETVVVCGLGVLGVLVCRLIEQAGGHVIAIEPQLARREAATHLGIVSTDPGDAAALEAIGAVPLAIECSGNPAALATVLGLLGHEGTVLVASWYGTKDVNVPLGGNFHRRRLTIRSTQVSTIPASLSGRWTRRRRIEHARDLAAALPLEQLATHTIPLRRAAEGYEQLDAGAAGVIHMAFGYG
jgi:2-desacetyl-2-hydroxyethyl bacteriochlorophyllide A dehydrogenase